MKDYRVRKMEIKPDIKIFLEINRREKLPDSKWVEIMGIIFMEEDIRMPTKLCKESY
jgi:hypothetical protein